MIVLLPLGKVDEQLLHGLHSELAGVFGSGVRVVNARLDVEQARDEKRNQYDSTRILGQVREMRPPVVNGSRKLLAVFPHDLFIPILTFVFGEAILSGDAAIVSYYRLQNERYGLCADPDLLLERLVKESVHEIGHLFGLRHCHTSSCVMRSSTSVEEIDLKPCAFCKSCAQVIAGSSVTTQGMDLHRKQEGMISR